MYMLHVSYLVYMYNSPSTTFNNQLQRDVVNTSVFILGQYRLLLRREQVYKLACNQWLTPDLKFQPMSTSETAWCWVGQDFSDNEAKLEQLAVKFKVI